MDLKRLRELQESLEVYGELDEGATEAVAARASKLARQRSGQTPKRKEMYQKLATQATKRSHYGSGSPLLSRFEKSQMHGIGITPASSQRSSETETLGGGTYVRGPKRLPKSQKKYIRQVASGVRTVSSQERERLGIGESYNIYDILISHLLDEGYAEDVKNAYCILENMSEDWVLEILDEAKWIQKAIKHPGAFSKKAQQHDMSPQEFAGYVSSHPEKFGTRTERQANLARTLKKISKD